MDAGYTNQVPEGTFFERYRMEICYGVLVLFYTIAVVMITRSMMKTKRKRRRKGRKGRKGR